MFSRIKRFFGIGSTSSAGDDDASSTTQQQQVEEQPKKRQKVESESDSDFEIEVIRVEKPPTNNMPKVEAGEDVLGTFLKELEQVFKREKEIPKRFVKSLKEAIDVTMNLPEIKAFFEEHNDVSKDFHIDVSKDDKNHEKFLKLFQFYKTYLGVVNTSSVVIPICDLRITVDKIVDDLLHALNCDEEKIEEVENFIDIYPKHLYIEREYTNENEEDDGFLHRYKSCKQLPIASFYDYSTDTWWANRTVFVPTLAKRMVADTGKIAGLYDRLEVRDDLGPFQWPVPIQTLMNMNCGPYIELQNDMCSFVIEKLWEYELLDSDIIDHFDLLWHSSTLATFDRFSTLVSLAPELMKTYRYQGCHLLTAKLKYDPVAPHLMGVLQACLHTHPKELGFLFEEFEDVESDSDDDDESESDDHESDDDGESKSEDDESDEGENDDEEVVDDSNEDGKAKAEKETSEPENIAATETPSEPEKDTATQEDNPPKKKQSAFKIAKGKIDETFFLECVEEQLEITNCPAFYEINKETNTYPFFHAAAEKGDLSVLYYLLRRHDGSLFLNATKK
ncbi:predicted protein [Chaetoceros tenuissimus]|uniref:Uncharacterized protein n=1 Tax=Chaetoceros tenuissimus TaxID=426638 RepID=A0AAD3CDN1_9STRA|nr:predicted protein [Chaetoceros tenuissimus]